MYDFQRKHGHDIDCHVLAPASTCSNTRASMCVIWSFGVSSYRKYPGTAKEAKALDYGKCQETATKVKSLEYGKCLETVMSGYEYMMARQ